MIDQLNLGLRDAVAAYVAELDERLPGPAEAIYLVGSAALGDWWPGRSDVDVLTATGRCLSDADLDALAGLHTALAEKDVLPYIDALYVDWRSVGADPDSTSNGHPHVVDGVFRRDGYRPDPVLWATMNRHGIAIRGPAAGELNVQPDAQTLRTWNLENLASYWRPLATQVRAKPADRELGAAFPAELAGWLALGPGRLHRTIMTGDVISKTAAADYTAGLFPAYTDVLERAKRWRRGEEGVTFAVADGRRLADLIDDVIEDVS